MMDKEKKKLSAYFSSLLGLLKIFEDAEHVNIKGDPVDILEREIASTSENFPDLVPEFNKSKYLSHSHEGLVYYRAVGIRSYLYTAITRIKAELESESGVPITQKGIFLL